MNIGYVGERIAALRMIKGISAREMSLALGQSQSYINKIENKISLPSMEMFVTICEFLGVTPAEFFKEKEQNPIMLKELMAEAVELEPETLQHIVSLIKIMNQKQN